MCTSSHLVCTVYSGQDLMLMRGGSQLYISRCKGKFCLLRCKNTNHSFEYSISDSLCVCPKCAHSSVYVLLQRIYACACMCDDLFGFVVIAGSLCVFICVQQHPGSASIGKSPLLLTVCLDTVYLCSDCRSQSGLRTLMYSSCSFSLPLLPSPAALTFFLFFSFSLFLFYCLFISEPQSSQTHSQHTEVYKHQSIHAHSSTHTCITHSAALRDI